MKPPRWMPPECSTPNNSAIGPVAAGLSADLPLGSVVCDIETRKTGRLVGRVEHIKVSATSPAPMCYVAGLDSADDPAAPAEEIPAARLVCISAAPAPANPPSKEFALGDLLRDRPTQFIGVAVAHVRSIQHGEKWILRDKHDRRPTAPFSPDGLVLVRPQVGWP